MVGRVSSPRFVGRREELAALEAALVRAKEGFGSVVIVAGEVTRAELREQVAAILDEPPPPPLVDRLLERSEGNPFFTEELLAASHQPGAAMPESLRDTLLARVEAHSDHVRDVLRIAAVAGRMVDHALLAAVAHLPEDDLNARCVTPSGTTCSPTTPRRRATRFAMRCSETQSITTYCPASGAACI